MQDEAEDGGLRVLNPADGRAGLVKEARLCRGFKKMYAKPGKQDPASRTSPQEQVGLISCHQK